MQNHIWMNDETTFWILKSDIWWHRMTNVTEIFFGQKVKRNLQDRVLLVLHYREISGTKKNILFVVKWREHNDDHHLGLFKKCTFWGMLSFLQTFSNKIKVTFFFSSMPIANIQKWCHGLKGRGSRILWNSTKASVIKSVTMGKWVKNCLN